ncbi:hypothetical protein GGQ82_002809, partial [Sphingobium olei]
MALLSVIRRWHFRDHLPIREIARRTCQTARKRDPVSASKRDPLFEIRRTVVGSALR